MVGARTLRLGTFELGLLMADVMFLEASGEYTRS